MNDYYYNEDNLIIFLTLQTTSMQTNIHLTSLKSCNDELISSNNL